MIFMNQNEQKCEILCWFRFLYMLWYWKYKLMILKMGNRGCLCSLWVFEKKHDKSLIIDDWSVFMCYKLYFYVYKYIYNLNELPIYNWKRVWWFLGLISCNPKTEYLFSG
jgi:hypothetical protein